MNDRCPSCRRLMEFVAEKGSNAPETAANEVSKQFVLACWDCNEARIQTMRFPPAGPASTSFSMDA